MSYVWPIILIGPKKIYNLFLGGVVMTTSPSLLRITIPIIPISEKNHICEFSRI